MTDHEWKYIDPEGQNPNRKGMLLSNEIKKFCAEDKKLLIADNFEEENLRPAAYTLRIGPRYVGSDGRPGTLSEKKSSFVMEPNSIVYVSTFETLNLPYYIAARFNLRVKWVYKGILLGTGPQVEPGYRGYLSCPLYNLTNSPIRITYREDFATIDFERTTDFCPGASREKIESSIKTGENLDKIETNGDTYLVFKQKEYPALKLLPGYDVLSSLSEMAHEVRTWRHIGIAFAVSFFALTLTLLSFGSNLFRQIADLTNETRTLHSNLQNSEGAAEQTNHELARLEERVLTLEKAVQLKQIESVEGKRK